MSDNWGFYFSEESDNIASRFVDLGLYEEAPIPDLVDVVWLRLDLREPRRDGLSSGHEFDQLVEIERALENTMAELPEAIYGGRNTTNSRRDFYFYCLSGRKAESLLASAMLSFPQYTFAVGSRPDPHWSIYFDLLYPTDREHQMIKNDSVLTNLKKHGDRHEMEREVTHWAYFKSVDDRACFVSGVAKLGFIVKQQHTDEDSEWPHGVTIEHFSAVDFVTINNAVLDVFDETSRCNGNYDGWETWVKRGDETESDSC